MQMTFDTSASFESFHVGWTFVPDILKACHLVVADVNLAGTFDYLAFNGDITGLADPHSDRYHLIPPAGVSRTTGALAKPDDLGEAGYDDRGPMWLWSGYLYVPPQVGHDVSSTTYGTQGGDNFLGQYHTWNRVYDIRAARWTTPDPAASPWTNLWSYCGANPVMGTDPSGLDDLDGKSDQEVKDYLTELANGKMGTAFPEFGTFLNAWLAGGSEKRHISFDWDYMLWNQQSYTAVDTILVNARTNIFSHGNNLECNDSIEYSNYGSTEVDSKPSKARLAKIAGAQAILMASAPVTLGTSLGLAGLLIERMRREVDVWLVLGRYKIEWRYTVKVKKVCETHWCIFESCDIFYEGEITYKVRDEYDFSNKATYTDPSEKIMDMKGENINKAKNVGASDFITTIDHVQKFEGSGGCD